MEEEKTPTPNARPLVILGAVAGLLGMLIGATGPLVSQVFLRLGLFKEVHVATKSVCQGLSHLVKTALFGAALGFTYEPWFPLICFCAIGVAAGTLLGKRLLGHLDVTRFVLITRLLLVGIAIKMLLLDVFNLAA